MCVRKPYFFQCRIDVACLFRYNNVIINEKLSGTVYLDSFYVHLENKGRQTGGRFVKKDIYKWQFF